MPEPSPRIRAATPADLDAYLDLVEVVAAEGRWIGAEAPIDRDQRGERWLEGVTDGAALRIVVDVGEQDAGGPVVGALDAEDFRGIVSFGMMLLPAWRGRGLGSGLLDALAAWARDRGAHKLALQVWPHNTAAIRLYERYGFEVEGRLRRHWKRRNGELWDALVMGLPLEPAGGAGGSGTDLTRPPGAGTRAG